MLIAPIVFTTVVVGIAHMGEMKDVGRIGLRALVYFEVVSTLALVIGLIVVTVLKPGSGVGFDPATADVSAVKAYTSASEHLSTVDFVLNVIPDTIVGGFARGEVLQVLLFSVLFGLALLRLGPKVHRLVELIEMTSAALFGRFFHQMLDRGFYLAPSAFEAAFIGSQHSDELVEETLAAAAASFTALR